MQVNPSTLQNKALQVSNQTQHAMERQCRIQNWFSQFIEWQSSGQQDFTSNFGNKVHANEKQQLPHGFLTFFLLSSLRIFQHFSLQFSSYTSFQQRCPRVCKFPHVSSKFVFKICIPPYALHMEDPWLGMRRVREGLSLFFPSLLPSFSPHLLMPWRICFKLEL